MKIQLIPNYYYRQPNFTHHTIYDDEFGQIEVADNDDSIFYDNEYQQKIRNQLRNDMYIKMGIVPYVCSSKMATSLEEANIINFQKLPNNSYAGGSLIVNEKYFDLLENNRITRIIDLAGFKTLADECKKRNIKYMSYATDLRFWENSIFKDDNELLDKYLKYSNAMKSANIHFPSKKEYITNIDTERRIFAKEFIDLIKIINEGNFYIGCELGDYRTKNILTLISNLNPDWKGKPFKPYLSEVEKCMINLYNNLTKDEKDSLGFNDEFTQKFENEFIQKGTV